VTETNLTPPWDTDYNAINAERLMADSAVVRACEIPDMAVWCPTCTGTKRRLVRVFWASVDEARRPAFVVPRFSMQGRAVPALYYLAPSVTERLPWRPPYGHCPRCRKGVLVFYPSKQLDFDSMIGGFAAIAALGGVPDPATGGPDWPRAGQDATVMKVERWEPGPFNSILLWGGAPTLGVFTE
jgi:hypothetical protein